MLADELERLLPAIEAAAAQRLDDTAREGAPKRLSIFAAELVAALRAGRVAAKPTTLPIGPDSFFTIDLLHALEAATYEAIEQHQLLVSAPHMRLIAGYFASAIEAALQKRIRLLGAMLDAIPDSILLTDADPEVHLLYLNRTAADNVSGMTGVPRDGLLGRAAAELRFPTRFAEQVTQSLSGALRGQATTNEVVVPTVNGDRWYERHSRPIIGADGDVEAIAIASRDIDARKRAEDKVAQELAFRERMMGILGHDLRNPVSAVLGLTGLMQLDEELSGKTRERIELIAQAARRMNEMIATLLDFTQMRFRGDLRLERRPTDLAEVTRAVVDELRAAHPQREISLASPGELRGEWDAARMAQLLSNLVANALTHGTPESPVRVELRLEEAAVALSVQNAGPTIPESALAHLFEPFYQARQEASRSRGLGLGLYIVHAIADGHGGSVDVRSADGWTTFIVRLPQRGSSTETA